MTNLVQAEADRIISFEEFKQLKPIVEINNLAIRCNKSAVYTGGDGYNLDSKRHDSSVLYATALYASICFAQDTIQEGICKYRLLLMEKCSLATGDTYIYRHGKAACYRTFPKCHGLGISAKAVCSQNMNDSAITLSRQVVKCILSL